MAKTDIRNSVSNLNDEQNKQLTKVIAAGAAQKLRMADEAEALKNIVNTASEDLNLDPKVIRKAIDAVYRQNFAETTEVMDEVSAVLSKTGNLSIATGQ